MVLFSVPIQEGGLQWLSVALGLYVALPLGILFLLKAKVQQGPQAQADVYDPSPTGRRMFLTFGVVMYGLALMVLWIFNAPADYRWIGATFLGGAVLVWLINRVWKVSIHATGAGGAAGLLVLSTAPGWPLALGLPILVGWARLARGAHNVPQVVTGTLLGAAVAWACKVIIL